MENKYKTDLMNKKIWFKHYIDQNVLLENNFGWLLDNFHDSLNVYILQKSSCSKSTLDS